jgi:hypothetical protein
MYRLRSHPYCDSCEAKACRVLKYMFHVLATSALLWWLSSITSAGVKSALKMRHENDSEVRGRSNRNVYLRGRLVVVRVYVGGALGSEAA